MATFPVRRALPADKTRTLYRLRILSPHGLAVVGEFFDDWRELAERVQHWQPEFGDNPFHARVPLGTLMVCTDRGVFINLVRLVECVPLPLRLRLAWFPGEGSVRCGIPVPGTAKFRGGNGWYRRPHTRGELRDNHAVSRLEEGGQRLVRAARSLKNLVDSHSDNVRSRNGGWKAQHRGTKSWDRTLHNA